MQSDKMISRRHLVQSGFSASVAAAIAGMTFPSVLRAQQATPMTSPVAGPLASPAPIPPKTLSGTVIMDIAGEPQSFQPDFQTDDNLWPMACNIYNSLFSLDNSFNVIPELATDYEVAKDGLSITMKLVNNATWHDGERFTSRDVKYTLQKIASEKSAAASAFLAAVDQVETPDAFTAVIKLNKPSASIIGFLSWYGVFMLPAHIYDGTDWTTNPANQKPVGTGPFKFSSYKTGEQVELVANDQYFGEGPYLEKLIYRVMPDANTSVQAFQNGELDFIGVPNAQVSNFQSMPDVVVKEKVYPSPLYFGFNFHQKELAKVEVRKAICQAIDRDQIVATALGGNGTTENRYYPAVIKWASNPDATAPALDVEAAKKALDAAGYPEKDGGRFPFKLLYFTGWPEAADTATVLKQQFDAIGLKTELVLLEWAAWEDQLKKGDFGIGLLGGFQGPDPANLAIRWGTGVGLNHWFYSNPKFDELLVKGDAGLTQDERAKVYFEAEKILAEDIPGAPLALQTFYTAWTTKLTGIWEDPDDEASRKVGMNRFTLTKMAS